MRNSAKKKKLKQEEEEDRETNALNRNHTENSMLTHPLARFELSHFSNEM